jgi:transglutaminase-like putative cysteine protease
MITRISRRLFSAEFMGLILVFAALQTLTYGISSSLRNTDTGYFFFVSLVAALIGLGLGKSKLNGIQASAGIAALGLIGVWILGAGLASPLLELGRLILSILPQIIPAIRSHTVIDTTPITEAWRVIVQASSALMIRLQTWTPGIDRNVAINDALIRNMIWILIMWLVSAWVGWFTSRRNAILALMPCILLLAAVTSYSEHKIETLWLMVLYLLFLMGVWNYRNHTQLWEKRKVDYSESIQYDVSQAVLFLSLTIATFAFITPSISWREIRDYLRERDRASESEAAEMLGIQKPPAPSKSTPAKKPSLPREHLLSGGYANSQKIVMTISTGELPPMVNPSLTADAPRYYWRSVTYDVYQGAGWFTSSAPSQRVQANTPLIPGLLNGYKRLHLDVQMVEPEGKLFWSGILYSADIPFTVDWRIRPQSSLFAGQSTLLQADMFAALTNTDSYRADSYIPNVSIEELRAATTDYPEELRVHYLALPSSVPGRVHELAREIVKGKANPYDKAKAIESYLRTTYPYDLEVPAPPEDRDVADFSCSNSRRDIATTMQPPWSCWRVKRTRRASSPVMHPALMMHRTQYVVRELNAHSWAEIYFPEIGWVEFEPTGSQPDRTNGDRGYHLFNSKHRLASGTTSPALSP